MLTVCGAGLPDPVGAENDTLVGFAPNKTEEPTVKLTASVFGWTPGTVDVTGTDAAYVPTPSDPSVARNVSGAGAVVADSNAAASQPEGCPFGYVMVPADSPLRVPPPVFETLITCGAGLEPPALLPNVADGGVNVMTGSGWTDTATSCFTPSLVAETMASPGATAVTVIVAPEVADTVAIAEFDVAHVIVRSVSAALFAANTSAASWRV